VNHVAGDLDSLEAVGRTSRGTEVLLDREYLRADLRILTGFVEPHFFAGFSGGAKSILPGVAGEATILSNHGAAILADSRAIWGVTAGNPVFEEARAAARLAPPSFILNVTMNRERAITGVFAGELTAAHDAACAFARESAMRAVAEPFDVVVTTNSGYPLDMNLYQAVKGMSAAAQVTKPGGAIVIAAECREGVGHGHFVDLLTSRESPRALLDTINQPGFQMLDQWQVQLLAELLLRHPIYLYSDRLDAEHVRRAHLRPSADLAVTVAEVRAATGPRARVAVMPEGPLTIPYLG
jgi:lactate racemase